MKLFIKVLLFVITFAITLFAMASVIYEPMQDYRMCIQEVKLCSDGSFVIRSGLECNFEECPAELAN